MAGVISDLDFRRDSESVEVVEEIARLERKIFPKHESLARSFLEEVRKKNSGLLYLKIGKGKGEEEIVGYVMYSWISSLCASITKLAVKENHRRQGHGEALLKAAIQKCRTRKVQRICLHVDPMRTPAVSLYNKIGFQIDEFIECYYSPERNAYRMYLDFND
ncbi:mycothiol acetyltransferase [Phoenix dactylifera]|uniref:Mycothiol acetyltransferase n=1 Tax=Phoenix dactylifera TaxID=42345 RepID=A0A8B7CUR2_PHODC|nr:mycothiol acetyltransferase [Phoenix dactylifera]